MFYLSAISLYLSLSICVPCVPALFSTVVLSWVFFFLSLCVVLRACAYVYILLLYLHVQMYMRFHVGGRSCVDSG